MTKIRVAAAAFAVISFLGIIDAAYLTVSHYRNSIPPCTLVNGCEQVLTSSYATFGDIPIALFGVINYLLLFIFTLIFLDTESTKVINLAAKFSVLGFLVSLGLVFLQIFVVKSLCLYCMFSAVISICLFLLGLLILRLNNSQDLSTRYFDK